MLINKGRGCPDIEAQIYINRRYVMCDEIISCVRCC